MVYVSVEQNQGEVHHRSEHDNKGKAVTPDGFIEVNDMEEMDYDTQNVARTANTVNQKGPRVTVDTEVQVCIDSDPIGQVQRDLHRRSYVPSLSPTTYYRGSVRIPVLNIKYFDLVAYEIYKQHLVMRTKDVYPSC